MALPDPATRLAIAKAHREEILAEAEAAAERAKAPYRDALARAELQEQQAKTTKAASAAKEAPPPGPLADLAGALAAIPRADKKPELTIGTDAGAAAAGVLAARVLVQHGEQIAEKVIPLLGGRPCLVIAGPTPPASGTVALFNARLQIITEARAVADANADAASAAWAALQTAPVTKSPLALVPLGAAITAGGAALQAAAAIGSYLIPDRSYGAVKIAGSDDRLLAIAVAGKLGGSAIFPQNLPPADADALLDDFGAWLATSAAHSETNTQRLASLGDAEDAAAVAVRAGLETAIASDKAARAMHQDLLALLATTDEAGTSFIARLLAEKRIDALLQTDAKILYLQVHATAGSSIGEKSAFSTPVMKVAGSAIISWLLTDAGGTTLAAEAIADISRHIAVEDVDSELEQARHI